MTAIDSQQRLHTTHEAQRERRQVRQLFKAHLSPAFESLVRHRANITGESTVSLATCEKIPTSDRDRAARSPETYEFVQRVSDAREAIQASIGKSREIQRKVLALVAVGEVSHALRLANCRQKSVQLECPQMAGGCGSEDNYVPIHCDSRLCPECMRRRQGQLAQKYRPVVMGWDHPTMFRLGSPKRVSPERVETAVDALRGAFGRLRRRVIPPDGDGWAWKDWKRALCAVGRHDLARRWQKRYVDQDKGIPFNEVVPAGFYGIDVKQGADGSLNVHAHVLAEIPWLPQAALSALWGEIHAAPVVDIRRVDGRGEQDMENAVMEVVGYAAKAPEFQKSADEAEYLMALKGSKLIQPFGELHGNTPESIGLLRCCDCEVSPAYWNYLGVLNGCHETAIVGDGTVGGKDPPGSDPEKQPANAFGV